MRGVRFDPSLMPPLVAGLNALGLDLSSGQQTALLGYVALLQRWNHAYNLTAVGDPLEMVPRHLLDSLSVQPWLQGPRVLDLGTGAGLPGIPLAIASPGRRFTLIDSNGKKTRFVRQAVFELGLDNVQVERVRIEDYVPTEPFDTLIVRAFASLSDILDKIGKLLHPGCRLLAMKGVDPQSELAALAVESLVMESRPLQVPGLDADRHLVLISPSPD